MPKGQTSLRGRHAGNGRFIPVERACANPNGATVERVPKRGFGERSSTPRGRDVGNGRFITIEEAERRRGSTVVERVPNPGQG